MTYPFVRLCLNGGGIRGVLQLGALQYIEEQAGQPLYQVFHKGMYGVSIGAVITSLLSFGFTTQQILASMDSLMSIQSALSPVRLERLMKIPTQKGLDDGEQLHATLRKVFATKEYDLDTLKISDAKCPLYIYASDLTKFKPVCFAPSIYLWDALRASTAIPFVYTPHIIKGRVFVDGGVMVDSLMKFLPETKRSSSLHIYCSRNLGIGDHKAMPFNEYVANVLNATYTFEHGNWRSRYPNNICVLQNNSVQALDFEKAKQQRSELIQQGYSTIQSFVLSQVRCPETSSKLSDPLDQHIHTLSGPSLP